MLTQDQLATLKVWLTTNANGLSDEDAATLLNSLASPQYFVWRTSLDLHVLTDNAGIGDDGVAATGFVWGGSQGGYINRSQGERDAFHALFTTSLTCKPALANVRTAIDDIFSGSGSGAVANRAHFRAAARRPATNLEKLFAIATVGGPTQTGARGSRANPDTMILDDYLVQPFEVRDARQLP